MTHSVFTLLEVLQSIIFVPQVPKSGLTLKCIKEKETINPPTV